MYSQPQQRRRRQHIGGGVGAGAGGGINCMRRRMRGASYCVCVVNVCVFFCVYFACGLASLDGDRQRSKFIPKASATHKFLEPNYNGNVNTVEPAVESIPPRSRFI